MSLTAARGAVILGVFVVLVMVMGLFGALGLFELLAALFVAFAVAWPLGSRIAKTD